MAKKEKKEGKILNKSTESAIDTIIQDADKIEEDLHVKTVAAESTTHLEADKKEGQVITLRFFEFKANPENFKKKLPNPQELFNAHVKQIEQELWIDGWTPYPDVPPRIMFAKDKSHYRIVVAAIPSKGSFLSTRESPLSLSELIYRHDSPTNS